MWYFSPVICIILAVFFFATAVLRIRKSVIVLTDRTLPEKEQLKILNVLSKFCDKYEEFEFLSSHLSGEMVYVDLKIKFRDETTYAQLKKFCREISCEMEKQIKNSRVSIVIDDDTIGSLA